MRRLGVAVALLVLVAGPPFLPRFLLTLLTQTLRILGLSTAMQFIVFGATIIVEMLVSDDRVASLLGRVLRPPEAPSAPRPAALPPRIALARQRAPPRAPTRPPPASSPRRVR